MPALDVPRLDLPTADHPGVKLPALGAPPEPATDAYARDLAFSHHIIAQRTPEGDTWARSLDLHGATSVWREFASHVPADAGPAQALVGSALSAGSAQAGVGKKQWGRQRPFQVDPTIHLIGRTPKPADTSYPSGHTARAYAAARVIAELDPTLEVAAFAMAREVALSRIYAGAHFASDVLAGARLGIAAGASVLERWRAGDLPGVTDVEAAA